ncbi:MAG: hypothetical protein BMS9Abin28_0795 [Anaerolineae bacterium]|nr:MAG: hypothetical protein BMS9Abin28_0795 [Anaerolineae bacterium]
MLASRISQSKASGEALALDWGAIDFRTGIVHVRRGKGGKARVTYVGAKTRRALLRWSSSQARAVSRKRGIKLQGADNIEERKSRSFQRSQIPQFLAGGWGGATLMARFSRKSGVHITFNMRRRTFTTWALNGGMDLLSLQRLPGHSSLEMVR